MSSSRSSPRSISTLNIQIQICKGKDLDWLCNQPGHHHPPLNFLKSVNSLEYLLSDRSEFQRVGSGLTFQSNRSQWQMSNDQCTMGKWASSGQPQKWIFHQSFYYIYSLVLQPHSKILPSKLAVNHTDCSVIIRGHTLISYIRLLGRGYRKRYL